MAAPVAKKHKHEDRIHSHIIPASGTNHFHQHRHGSRVHSHALPDTGKKHFHRVGKKPATKTIPKARKPRQNNKFQNHRHGSRVHAHKLPPSGKNHYHVVGKKTITAKRRIQAKKSIAAKKINKKPQNKKAKVKLVQRATKTKTVLASPSNSVEHKHFGRTHSHKLPSQGVNHLHSHRHGNRAHLHAYPKSGVVHQHGNGPKNKDFIASRKVPAPVNTNKAIVKAVKPSKPKPAIPLKTNASTPAPMIYSNAVNGDREAQYMLGSAYESGKGFSVNLQEAFKWYTKSAEQGHSTAQFRLANLYVTGRGVSKDRTKARFWFQKAANQGNAQAKISLQTVQ